ncbi:MAG: YdcF family protein [Spirochaetales bacterium]|nr:YdcF family protein [Spirochaetales bacterium]
MTALILPPGIILAVMFVSLVLIRKRKVPFILILILFLLSWTLCLPRFADFLLAPLEQYAEGLVQVSDADNGWQTAADTADLIVVLGGGSIVRQNSQSELFSQPASVTVERAVQGVVLHHKTGLPLLFTGGNVLKGEGAPGESEGIGRLFRNLGIPEMSYILESESRNTYENAMYTAALTEHRNIVLVTSAFHMKRGILCFEAEGFTIVSVNPVDYKRDHKKRTLLDYLPSMEALHNSYTALHEYWGILYYKLIYL